MAVVRLLASTARTVTAGAITVGSGISRFPCRECPRMPGSLTQEDWDPARLARNLMLPSPGPEWLGVLVLFVFGALYLACAFPCQRLTHTLADRCS